VVQKQEGSGMMSQNQPKGHPFVVNVIDGATTGEEIHRQVQRLVKRTLQVLPIDDKMYKIVVQSTSYSLTQRTIEVNDEVVALGERESLLVLWKSTAGQDVLEWDTLMDPTKDQVQIASTMNETKTPNVNLYDCLNLFTREEMLGENDTWYCPSCKQHQRALLKMQLWKLPSHLIIHLKRFQSEQHYREKIDTMVDVPTTIDISHYTFGPNQSAKYSLYAVSNHSGSLYGGHYTASALNHVDGKWYTFNDSSCSEMSGSLVSQAAYVLFFKRVDEGVTVQPDGSQSDMTD
jgi:hypothetical protein